MSDDRRPEAVRNCPFCPDNGMVQMLAESSFGYAVYALNPPVPGCILLIPKHHVTDYFDLVNFWHAEEVILLRQLMRSEVIHDYTMYTPSWNLSSETGQQLEHLHHWWVPRLNEKGTTVYRLGTATLIALARSQSAQEEQGSR